jgi:hypothetical protein
MPADRLASGLAWRATLPTLNCRMVNSNCRDACQLLLLGQSDASGDLSAYPAVIRPWRIVMQHGTVGPRQRPIRRAHPAPSVWTVGMGIAKNSSKTKHCNPYAYQGNRKRRYAKHRAPLFCSSIEERLSVRVVWGGLGWMGRMGRNMQRTACLEWPRVGRLACLRAEPRARGLFRSGPVFAFDTARSMGYLVVQVCSTF